MRIESGAPLTLSLVAVSLRMGPAAGVCAVMKIAGRITTAAARKTMLPMLRTV
jgi:hypothetical protein